MDTTATELRYLDLIEAYSPEELKRLPVEIQKFRFDLTQLVAATDAGFSVGIPFGGYTGAVEKIEAIRDRQLSTKVGLDVLDDYLTEAKVELHRKFLRRMIARANRKLQRLMEQSSAIYERMLAEYLFICRTVELNELISLKKADLMDAELDRFLLHSTEIVPEGYRLVAERQTESIRIAARAGRAMADRRLSAMAQTFEEAYSRTETQYRPVPQEGITL